MTCLKERGEKAKKALLEDYQKGPQKVNKNVLGKEGKKIQLQKTWDLGEKTDTGGVQGVSGREGYRMNREKELLKCVH